MVYRMVYLRIRSGGCNFGWTSSTAEALKEESLRIFQELGWTFRAGSNGVMDEANIQPLQGQLSKAHTFQCYHCCSF